MPSKLSNYRIKFSVNKFQAQRDLDLFIRDMNSNLQAIRAKRQRKKSGRNISITEKQMEMIKNLRDNLKFGINGDIYNIIKDVNNKIKDNIQTRLNTTFWSSTRLQRAVLDKRFSKIIVYKDEIEVGIGSFEALDEYTLVYIQDPTAPGINGKQEKMFYTPPSEYPVESWWYWHEFSGTLGKDSFTSRETFWWVMRNEHVNNRSGQKYSDWSGGFKSRPFIKDGESFFEEDDEEINAILRRISINMLNRIKISNFGR